MFSLTAVKLFDHLKSALSIINNCGATVFALICDNNRVNQSCYKNMFTPVDSAKPWIAKNPCNENLNLFLMFDTVHIMKNIRNNWITEKSKTLLFFYHDGNTLEATWQPLIDLYNHENSIFFKKFTSNFGIC